MSLEASTETVTPAEISTEKPKRVRKPRKTKAQRDAEEAALATNEPMIEVLIEATPPAALEALKTVAKPKTKRVRKPAVKKTAAVAVAAINAAVVAEPLVDAVAVLKVEPEPEPKQPVVSKKRGWWSRG